MRYNEIHFDFAMTPVEAEGLYRDLNLILGVMDEDDPNFEATKKFHDRVLNFCRKHPCQYGAIARDTVEVRIIPEGQLEAINCPECGSGNVLEAPDSCKSCAKWREALHSVKV